MQPEKTFAADHAMKVVWGGMFLNILLAIIKFLTGVLGNSYALIADAIESTLDIMASILVWGGLRIAVKPADINHPYGHGRAEPLAAMAVAFMLLGAAIGIAIQSIREIITPHHAPAPFTLLVLALVVACKEIAFRFIFKAGKALESTSVKTDAWHHRSDALTSAAAFIGISIALIGGKGYECADDWAALSACLIIGLNGYRFLRVSLSELMDERVDPQIEAQLREIALKIEGVRNIEKCRFQKFGLFYYVDVHVRVDGNLTVYEGHRIAHQVKDALIASSLRINDVSIHIEPA
ncbi:MAG: cation diffusion facilitator family transporter [Verrucomicrobiota bacterium]